MSEEYTVPALRDQADRMRKQAEDVLTGAQVEAQRILNGAQDEAEKLRRAAAEIDKLADGQMSTEPEPPFTVPCWNCNQPTMKDPLGFWRHAPGIETACQVPGPDEHEANRTAAGVTRTDGEVAGNA